MKLGLGRYPFPQRVDASFVDIGMIDTADDYRALARREYESMRGTLKRPMIGALGVPGQARFEEMWRAMTVVLDRDELRPGRFWAREQDA